MRPMTPTEVEIKRLVDAAQCQFPREVPDGVDGHQRPAPEELSEEERIDNTGKPEMALFGAILLRAFQDACANVPEEPVVPTLSPETFDWCDNEKGRRRNFRNDVAFMWIPLEPGRDGKPRRQKYWRDDVAAWRRAETAHRAWKRLVNEREDARRWLNSNNPAFRDVCLFAGYDHEYIDRKAKDVEANGWRPLRTIPTTETLQSLAA